MKINKLKNSQISVLLGCLILSTWIYIFSNSLMSAIKIWWISDIFNHCFFVIPGTIYLIYCKRAELLQCDFKANYWLLVPIISLLLLFGLGVAGDVQLFMHIATFCSLPLIIWMLIGNQAARVIAFPLGFILFAIPVGEELIPWLQAITADISVALLAFSQVPVYRTGLYIQIPGGTFLVAEACSGISFFIACIVIGSLYTYLNIQSWPKKTVFILISVLYPILANAIRVYGIILTAHLSDMEYAVGADHLIYGGVFFAIVIISLLFCGELFRSKSQGGSQLDNCEATNIDKRQSFQFNARPFIVIFLLLLLCNIWVVSIQHQMVFNPKTTVSLRIPASFHESASNLVYQWQPKYLGSSFQSIGIVDAEEKEPLDYFIAYYPAGKGELVSSLNRLYQQERWTIVSSDFESIKTNKGEASVYFEDITDSSGNHRFLASWYVVNGQIFADKRRAKLQQIINIMLGKPADSGVVALSQSLSKQPENQKQIFMDKVANYHQLFSNVFPFESSK